ncbi:MAG: HIT family protein [Chloroflexi bacterium]|nr:HIT family protein [Chloroflexota bacterium]
MNDCPFCKHLASQTEIIIENELCVFLQREEPVLIGSGLIIPRAHRETVFDLTHSEWTAIYEMIHRTKNLLDQAYHPDGYNLGWNCGTIGGQDVFHAHLHIIPRFKEEPLAGKGIRYWLKQESNKRK